KDVVFEPTMVKMPENPWNEIQVSSSSHLIAVVADGMEDIFPGDVIGVFSTDGNCYGVSEVSDSGQNTVISVYADDNTTTGKDGFENGEAFNLRLYAPESGEEYDLEVVYDKNLPGGMFFSNEGLSAISQLKLSGTGLNGNISSGISIYPNPTNDVVWITGIENFDEIEVMNSTGKVLLLQTIDEQEKISLDLSSLSSGIYHLKLTGDDFTVIRKIIKD
nr:T9SS type A sorting domain-containing protein [Bacteroidota bacterium]